MHDSLGLRRPDRLHDDVALDEIELYAEVLIAVADADHPLSPTEIDRVLGVGTASTASGEAHRSANERAAAPGAGGDRARGPGPDPRAPGPDPREAGEGELRRDPAWSSADPLSGGRRLSPTVLPPPREVPESHVLWAPLPLSPWYV